MSFQSNAETNARQNDSQQEARASMDGLARELRNLASPTNEQPYAIKRKEPQDLIVQSVADVRRPERKPAQHPLRALLLRRCKARARAPAHDLDHAHRSGATGH